MAQHCHPCLPNRYFQQPPTLRDHELLFANSAAADADGVGPNNAILRVNRHDLTVILNSLQKVRLDR